MYNFINILSADLSTLSLFIEASLAVVAACCAAGVITATTIGLIEGLCALVDRAICADPGVYDEDNWFVDEVAEDQSLATEDLFFEEELVFDLEGEEGGPTAEELREHYRAIWPFPEVKVNDWRKKPSVDQATGVTLKKPSWRDRGSYQMHFVA